jgi:hypothetical protein
MQAESNEKHKNTPICRFLFSVNASDFKGWISDCGFFETTKPTIGVYILYSVTFELPKTF